jgi:hypothetical protein
VSVLDLRSVSSVAMNPLGSSPCSTRNARDQVRNRSIANGKGRLDVRDAGWLRHLTLQHDRLFDRKRLWEHHLQIEIREPFDEVAGDDASVHRDGDDPRQGAGERGHHGFDDPIAWVSTPAPPR